MVKLLLYCGLHSLHPEMRSLKAALAQGPERDLQGFPKFIQHNTYLHNVKQCNDYYCTYHIFLNTKMDFIYRELSLSICDVWLICFRLM